MGIVDFQLKFLSLLFRNLLADITDGNLITKTVLYLECLKDVS